MAVFEEYYDCLTETIGGVSDNSFVALAGKLFSKKIISMDQKNSAKKKGLIPGAEELIDAVINYVRGSKEEGDRTREVLDIMSKVEWLRDIVKKMRAYVPPIVPKVKSIHRPPTNSERGDDMPDGPTLGASKFRVFISYTRREGSEHMERVEKLYQKLAKDEGLYVFKDDHEITEGEKLTPRLLDEIHNCSLFVSIMSSRYFESEWCYKEFKTALEKEKHIFPIEHDDGNGKKFEYPQEFTQQHKDVTDILRYTFDNQDRNKDTQIARCVTKIIEFVNKLQQHR